MLHSIAADHDLRLVVLALVICGLGAVATMGVSSRALDSRRPTLWLFLVSVCAGCTVWATHFIAMLAYLQGVATTYDPALTALSFAAGVVIMGAGFRLAIRGARTGRARSVGGAVVGVGVVVLHYIGMAALRMPATLGYAPALVAASIVLSIGFGAQSLQIGFGCERARARIIGALLMAGMILSLHFTAMGAVHVQDGVVIDNTGSVVTRSVLAIGVAVACVLVLLIGMAGALMENVAHQLAAEADRFRTLADGAFEGLIVHRDGVIVDANPAARRLLGVNAALELSDWHRTVVDAGHSLPAVNRDRAVEVELQRLDGSRFPAEICRRRIRLSDGGEGELCAIRDLTARKEAEACIAHLALHDALTELPNRRFFMEFAQKSVARAQRNGDGFAVLVLDLDDFKRVNDTHGHAAGDELIRILARRIAGLLREADMAARLGGDEFAILTTGARSPRQALGLAERLLQALQVPVQLDYGEVALTVSIGIALFPDDGPTVERMLRNADTAMYRAKTEGRSTIRFFEPEMDAALVARRKLEHGLRRAVTGDGLTVEYQPVVEAQGRAPVGFEALVRWTDSELGSVAPADFIPVAEETGLIMPIAQFVLLQACMDAMTWPGHLRVAVNLSAAQFRRKGLLETVRSALECSGLPGHRLELEVTETLLVNNREEALRQLLELRALGVRISLDDFGTGYCALSYLQAFPFDRIKVDRAFVTDVASSPQNASIVRAITAMGHSLEMRVIAEGVETEIEADMLRDLDCDELQGFLIARPMPASDVMAFLAGYPGRVAHAVLRQIA